MGQIKKIIPATSYNVAGTKVWGGFDNYRQ